MMVEEKNPRWVAWEKAGSPKPSPDFPNAGAFMLWCDAAWRAFEKLKGWKGSSLGDPLWRSNHAAEFAVWLDAGGTP